MRVSRTVLREAEGVTPSAYSPSYFVAKSRGQRAGTILMHRFKPSMVAGVPAFHGLQACLKMVPALWPLT